MKIRGYSRLAAAIAAVSLVAGCGPEEEERIEEEMPVAAPAPELTAPADPLDTLSDTLDGDTIGAVP